MPIKNTMFCDNCLCFTTCIYIGRRLEREYFHKLGFFTKIKYILGYNRPKLWKCSECGEIFEED